MESRMDKYYRDNSNVLERSKRNEKLYQDVANQMDNFDRLPVPDNANEIDINGLKKIISSRDEYRKAKELERTSMVETPIREKVTSEEKKTNKVYDINVLLENAKNEINRSADVTKEKKITANFLTDLEDANIPNNDDAMEISSIVEEKNHEKSNTDSLPLDILTDLKGGDNTIVTDPIVKDEVTFIKKIKDGETFYSGSYSFSKKDFADDDDDDEPFIEDKSHNGIKIFFLILGLIVVAVVIYLIIVKYIL